MLAAGAVQAQDLLSVYDLALENDPALKEAAQQLASAREVMPQSKAQLLPNIFVGGDLAYVNRDTRSSASSTNEGTEDFSTYSLALRLQQPVYRRDYWMQLDQAENQIAQAEANYASAELDLMARVINAYFNILSAQDDLTVSKAQTEANQRQLEQAQQRFDVGLIAITDVHEAQAAYDRSRATQIAAENEVDNSWEALFQIIGPQPRDLAKLGEKLPLDSPEPDDIESWANSAVEQNYAIIAAMNAAEVARKQIEVARSGHYPTVDLEASYGASRSNANSGSDIDDAQIGLQLTIPLYQGGGTTSRVRQAQYDYEAAKEALDRERRSVNSSVRNAYRSVISTISQVKALHATTISSKSALESTQAGYEVGTRTLVDVLAAQTQMFSATRDYLRSRYDYLINGLLLKQRASILSREDLSRVNNWLGK
jgi:outer membrane protein